jgi:hypothetical protein
MKNIIVIGAGLAGSLVSNQLSKNYNVTLIEIGPRHFVKYPRVDYINKSLAGIPTFCFGSGGTTNLWHNGLIPIKTDDITNSFFRNVLADAKTYIDQAACALHFPISSFFKEYNYLIDHFNTFYKFSVFSYGIDALLYPKNYRKITVDPNVEAFFNVHDLEFIIKDRHVASVTIKINGQKKQLNVDVLVCCAGALGTPSVLRNITSYFGIEPKGIGSGFIDHPVGFIGKVKFRKDITTAIKKLSAYDKGDYICRYPVRLKSHCGMYTGCAYFRPAITMTNNLALYKYKSALGASSGINRVKKMTSPKLFHPDVLAEIISHLFHVNIPGRTFNILFVGEQKRGTNRVFWEGDRLMVDWSISDDEIAIYRGMLRQLEEMLKDLADEMNLKTDITEDWLWSMAHHSGTVSLGDSDDDLVDRDLKLRCCDNVFVCDGSVIQEHSYANTGLTIGQLALRLVERIKCSHL